MRHRLDHKRLNRPRAHRKALLRNLVTELFRYEKIKTSITKAKETRRFAERIITYAKKGDLHHRRLAFRFVRDKEVVTKLFEEIGPRFAEREGGYTRIIKLGQFRKGDNTELTLLELVEEDTDKKKVKTEKNPAKDESNEAISESESNEEE